MSVYLSVLMLLSNVIVAAPADLRIVCTIDNTEGSCGCGMGGQAGLQARIAAIVERLRDEDPSSCLILSLGNVSGASVKFDTMLSIYRELGYSAICPSLIDLSLCPDFKARADAEGLSVVNANQGVKLKVGGHQVVVFNLAPNSNLPDIVSMINKELGGDEGIVVSRLGLDSDQKLVESLPATARIPLVIDTEGTLYAAPTPLGGRTSVVLPEHKGSTVLLVTVRGDSVEAKNESVVVGGGIDSNILKIYNDFLTEQAQKADPGSLPPAPPPEVWRYEPARTCKECHPKQYASWVASKHAAAMATLKHEGRERERECLSCHDTFSILHVKLASLKDEDGALQCAICHGGSEVHVKTGDKRWTFRKVSKKVCLRCHTTERSPGFNFETYYPQITH